MGSHALAIDIGQCVFDAVPQLPENCVTKLHNGDHSIVLEKKSKWIRLVLKDCNWDIVSSNQIALEPFFNIVRITPIEAQAELSNENADPVRTLPPKMCLTHKQHETVVEGQHVMTSQDTEDMPTDNGQGEKASENVRNVISESENISNSDQATQAFATTTTNVQCLLNDKDFIGKHKWVRPCEVEIHKDTVTEPNSEETTVDEGNKTEAKSRLIAELEKEFNVSIFDITYSDGGNRVELDRKYFVSCVLCDAVMKIGDIHRHLRNIHQKRSQDNYLLKNYSKLKEKLSYSHMIKCMHCDKEVPCADINKHEKHCETLNRLQAYSDCILVEYLKCTDPTDKFPTQSNIANITPDTGQKPNTSSTVSGTDVLNYLVQHTERGKRADDSVQSSSQNTTNTSAQKNSVNEDDLCDANPETVTNSARTNETAQSKNTNKTIATTKVPRRKKTESVKFRIRQPKRRRLTHNPQTEKEIIDEIEKDFGVKVEILGIDTPDGNFMENVDYNRRFSISCFVCGDQIPQNSIAMHFKENHSDQGDIAEITAPYLKIKRKLRDLRSGKCSFCSKQMRITNLQRHMNNCKSRDNAILSPKSGQLSPRKQSPSPTTEIFEMLEDTQKEPSPVDLLKEKLSEISKQFNIEIKLNLDADNKEQIDIWEEQLPLFSLSCDLCHEDIPCPDITAHLKTRHNINSDSDVVNKYTKIKRRIRELQMATCRWCGSSMRSVNVTSHETGCKLNPSNQSDVQDSAAEQQEIDAILDCIHDTFRIRIVRANTQQPPGTARQGVVNESFIITCDICRAQFEHFDIEEHLMECHSDDPQIALNKERYRQALVMLVGDNEAECLFCNEKQTISELAAHMRMCKAEAEGKEAMLERLATATDLDLLVQSLSRRSQVEISRVPVYAEDEAEDKDPLFLVTCEICGEGVLHLSMRRHLRKLHPDDCTQDILNKYRKIGRRLQDLRKVKCVYCSKFFRVVSLRAHVSKCKKDKSNETNTVVDNLIVDKASTFSEKIREATSKNNLDPGVICESIFNKYNVKARFLEDKEEYEIECELCDGWFPVSFARMHVQVMHSKVQDHECLLEKYKLIARRIRSSQIREKASTRECAFCAKKIKMIYRTSYNYHLSECVMNPDRDSVNTDPLADDMDEILSDDEKDEKITTPIDPTIGETRQNGEPQVTNNMHNLDDHICEICEEMHDTATELVHHMTKEHRSHDRYHSLWRQANKQRHRSIRKLQKQVPQKEPKRRCAPCGFKTDSLEKLREHRKDCSAVKNASHVCDLCGYVSKNNSARWYHMKTRHGLGLGTKKAQFYPCPICGKVCDVPSRLEKHLLTHTDKRNYICDECAQPFKTAFALKRHIERIHNNIYPFYCDKCGHGLKNELWVRRHRCERRRKQRVGRVLKNKCSPDPSEETTKPCTRNRSKSQSKINTEPVVNIPPQPSNTIEIRQLQTTNTMETPYCVDIQPMTSTVHHMAENVIEPPIGQEDHMLLSGTNQIGDLDVTNVMISHEEEIEMEAETHITTLQNVGNMQPNPVAVDVSEFFQPAFDYTQNLEFMRQNNPSF